jgi:hypothetical protein
MDKMRVQAARNSRSVWTEKPGAPHGLGVTAVRRLTKGWRADPGFRGRGRELARPCEWPDAAPRRSLMTRVGA